MEVTKLPGYNYRGGNLYNPPLIRLLTVGYQMVIMFLGKM